MGQLTFQATLGGAVNLVGPNTASTTSFTLPSADGTSGQALTTNGSGTLAFGTLAVTAGGTGVTTSTGSGSNVLSASPTLTGDVTLNAQGDLRFADSDSSNWVAFQAPATISSNVTWTLPSADGTSNQVLTTNGSGTLSWSSASGSSQWTTSGSNIYYTTGNVGIGTATPTFATGGGLQVKNASFASVRVTGGSNTGLDISQTSTGTAYVYLRDNFPLVFGTNNTEIGRFSAVGYFKATNFGSYPDGDNTLNHYFTSNNSSNSTVFIRGDSSSLSGTEVFFIRGNTNTTNNTYRLIGANNGNDSGRFQVQDSGNVVNTNNSYGSISDEKLKQDIIDASSQWNDIKNVRVRKFRFKNNPTGPLILGVIAQELETVSAGLIEQEQDFEDVQVPVLDSGNNPVLDENGNVQTQMQRNMLETTTKSVKYSVLYMKAVKALQEAMARIEQLETRLDSANL